MKLNVSRLSNFCSFYTLSYKLVYTVGLYVFMSNNCLTVKFTLGLYKIACLALYCFHQDAKINYRVCFLMSKSWLSIVLWIYQTTLCPCCVHPLHDF